MSIMETYSVICKSTTQTKNQVTEELNKIHQCLYKIVLFVARKN